MGRGPQRLGNIFGKDLESLSAVCTECGVLKNILQFYLRTRIERNYSNLYVSHYRCIKCENKRTRRYSVRKKTDLRQAVLDKFGNKCARCGFDDPRALQLDHINGGGSRERKLPSGSRGPYRKALKDSSGQYQLLCANCNWIKRYENNELNLPVLADCE